VSSGRAEALVTRDPAASEGRVLVVPSLDPGLAGVLGGLAALVSETGSPLSHLAILAREQRLPVVVGVLDAATLHDGDRVLVDGAAGTIEVLDRADVGARAVGDGLSPVGAVADEAVPPAERGYQDRPGLGRGDPDESAVADGTDEGCPDGVVAGLLRRCA
jgi:pyruvate,water dikinase